MRVSFILICYFLYTISLLVEFISKWVEMFGGVWQDIFQSLVGWSTSVSDL